MNNARTVENRRTGHPIRVVASRTGVSPTVLRAWERRYGAVEPGRSEGGQRVYSEEDLHRIALLSEAVEEGRQIGTVATLPTTELERLVMSDREARGRGGASGLPGQEELLRQALEAAREMEPTRLDRVLVRAALILRPDELVDDLVIPFLRELGEAWRRGAMGPAVEHAATLTLRRFLEWLRSSIETDSDAPRLIAGTPSGQRHEFGALLATVTASMEGWRSTFLGPDLPVEELVDAARKTSASALALSVVHPPAGPDDLRRLGELRDLLPDHVELMVGGAGLAGAEEGLARNGVEVFADLEGLRQGLREVYARRFGRWPNGAAR